MISVAASKLVSSCQGMERKSMKSVLWALWSTLRTTELLCQLSCEHRPRSLTQKPAWHDHWGIALTKCAGQPFG